MTIYIFTLCFIFCLWIIINKLGFAGRGIVKYRNKNKIYIICVGIWLFLLQALRNYSVGRDTYTYLQRYNMFANVEWKDVSQLADQVMFEHGFSILIKVLSYINCNPRFFLVVSSFIIVLSYSLFILKNSTMPWLSYFMFITLGMFNDTINITRQYLAVVISFYSYKYIKNNNLFYFMSIILLASTIHKSALIVLPMFWISKIKFNKNNIFLILSGTFVFLCYFFGNLANIFKYVSPYIGTYERYYDVISTQTGSGAVGLTLIYIPFLFLVIIELYNSADESRNMYMAFSMTSVILVLLTFKIGIVERLIPYFSTMFLFSIPKAMTSIRNHIIRDQYLFIICIVLILYYFFIICKANVSGFLPYKLWDSAPKWI